MATREHAPRSGVAGRGPRQVVAGEGHLHRRTTASAVAVALSDAHRSILWGNSGNELFTDTSALVPSSFTVRFSDIRGGFRGSTSIDVDPLFVAPAGKDLRLRSGSPCINAGDDTAIPADLLDLDRDNDLIEPAPFDLAGRPRKVTRVDMGAYEQ